MNQESKQRVLLSKAFVALLLFALPLGAAVVDGVWQVRAQSDQGPREARMTLKEKAEKLSGVFVLDSGEEMVIRGSKTGDRIEVLFDYSADGRETLEVRLSGKLDGDKINGVWDSGTQTGSWTASRAR